MFYRQLWETEMKLIDLYKVDSLQEFLYGFDDKFEKFDIYLRSEGKVLHRRIDALEKRIKDLESNS